MRTFKNQSLGSFDIKEEGNEYAFHQWVEVSFDETRVSRFKFHSVMVRVADKAKTRLHGIEVEARYVFQACQDFHTTTHSAVAPDGHEFFVTQTWSHDGKTQQFHAGDKFGPVIAEMKKTGYVQ